MQQTAAKPATLNHKAASETPILDAMLDQEVTYKPFMGGDSITLTARIVLDTLCTPTKAGHYPTINHAAKFVRLCQARGLNPWEGDAFLVGFDTKDGPQFSLVTAHQAFLKRAEVHPQFDGMESGIVVKSDKDYIDQPGDFIGLGQILIGGWARVHMKGRSIPTYRRCNLSVYNTGYSRWAKDPGGMICKVAEADALRSSCPNSLGGLYLREELESMESTVREAIPMPRATDEPPPAAVEPTTDELTDHVDTILAGDEQEAPIAEQTQDPIPEEKDTAWHVSQHEKWLVNEPDIEAFNDAWNDLWELEGEAHDKCKKVMQAHGKTRGWAWGSVSKKWVVKPTNGK